MKRTIETKCGMLVLSFEADISEAQAFDRADLDVANGVKSDTTRAVAKAAGWKAGDSPLKWADISEAQIRAAFPALAKKECLGGIPVTLLGIKAYEAKAKAKATMPMTLAQAVELIKAAKSGGGAALSEAEEAMLAELMA